MRCGRRDSAIPTSQFSSQRTRARKILLMKKAPRHRKERLLARRPELWWEEPWAGWRALEHWRSRVLDHSLRRDPSLAPLAGQAPGEGVGASTARWGGWGFPDN